MNKKSVVKNLKVKDNVYFYDNSIILNFKDFDYVFLILSDLHLNFDSKYSSMGIDFLLKDYKDLFNKIVFLKNDVEKIFNKKVSYIIFNGDIIDEFSLTQKNRLKVKKFFSLIKDEFENIVLIKGNHDVMLKTFFLHENFVLKDFFVVNNFLIYHGDKSFLEIEKKLNKKSIENIDTFILGHEHPVFLIDDGIVSEKFKCIFTSNVNVNFKIFNFKKNIDIVLMPSFNPDILGSNVNDFVFMNDLLNKVFYGNIFIFDSVDKKVLYFGKTKKEE